MKSKVFTTTFWKNVFVPEEPIGQDVPQEHSPKMTEGKALVKVQTEDNGNNTIATIVRSELNLEQNSIFAVSTYHKKSREIVFRETTPTGEVSERRVIIGKMVNGIETGVLTTQHFKIYLALIKFWEDAERPLNDSVNFTIRRLLIEIGIADTGPNYETAKRLLRELIQIPLTFKSSFFVPKQSSVGGNYETLEDFHILGSLYINERESRSKEQKTRSYGRFRFSDAILSSLASNYTHPLRLDIIRGFKKHRDLSILLYTYLDRNLAFKDKYEIGLEKLFDHLDISQDQIRYPSDRKAKIKPVLEQIRGKELSTGILSSARVDKTKDRKDYKLVCHKRPFPKRLKGQEEYQPELNLWDNIEVPGDESGKQEAVEQNSGLLPLLIEKGLTQKQASKLIEEKEPGVISDQLMYLPFRLKEYKAQGKEINEAAILYESINDNWSAPKDHLGVEKEKEREAERIERERIARLEQEERDKSEQERVKMEAYKKTLDPDERAKLRERALEQIRSMEGINEQFINEPLIMSKENEILKSEIG